MRRLALAALVAAPLALAACATFDEVERVPDALAWSYFEGTPAEVADAARRVFTMSGYTVEGIDDRGGSFVLSVSSTPPSADLAQVLVEAAPPNEARYTARAQTLPRGRRLPSDLARAIQAEL